MPDPFDLANVIALDHSLAERLFTRLEAGEGDREVLLDKVITFVSLHAGAEEAVFYPALKKHLDDGKDVASTDLDVHQRVKDALVVISDDDATPEAVEDALRIVIAEVREHAQKEEQDQLPRLRAAVGDEEMVALGTKFQTGKAGLPSRPHPHAPASRPGNLIAGAVAGPLDKLKDKRQGRAALQATDGSGRLDAEAQAVVDKLGELGLMPYEILEPKVARKLPTVRDAVTALLEERNLSTEPQAVDTVTDHVIDNPEGDIAARLFRPLGVPDGLLPVILYVHGGGWVVADIDVYDATPRALANATGALVLSVEYRRAPEHPFPAAHDDVLRAAQWLLSQAESIGGDPARIAVAGESAGANMVASVCLDLKAAGGPVPVFQLLVYPVTSPEPRTASYPDNADAVPLNPGAMAWFGHHTFADPDDAKDLRVSLLDVPVETLAGLPPAYVVLAEVDPLRDEGQLYADHLAAAGVAVQVALYEGVPHEFFGTGAVVAQARKAVADSAAKLVEVFNAGLPAASQS